MIVKKMRNLTPEELVLISGGFYTDGFGNPEIVAPGAGGGYNYTGTPGGLYSGGDGAGGGGGSSPEPDMDGDGIPDSQDPMDDRTITEIGIPFQKQIEFRERASNLAQEIMVLATVATGGAALDAAIAARLVALFGESYIAGGLAAAGGMVAGNSLTDLLEDTLYDNFVDIYVQDYKDDGNINGSVHLKNVNWDEYNKIAAEYNAYIESLKDNQVPEFGDPDWD